MRVYQIMVDRFSTGNKRKDAALALKTSRRRMGGNLRGVENKLEYIKKLGFDAIWLTPISEAAEYNGYSVLDFYKIDPHFGSNKDLKQLVDKAHKLGIKVILDFVANHVSNQHNFFRSAFRDKRSMYRKWFVFDKSGTYKCFLDVKTLPKLNTENDEVINYLIDAASYWIKEFGIDGYRLDHAIGPSTKFWSEFVSECLKLDNRLMFMPEIWLTGIKTEHLDTLWFLKNEEKLRERLRAILFKNQGKNWDIIGDSDAEEFAMSALNNIFKTPLDFSQNFKLRRQYSEDKIDYSTEHFAFADNHDMQRISWILKNDRNRIDNSIRKVRKFKNSVVYYGTEIYLSQKKDFGKLSTFQDTECRRFMDWGSVNDTVINRFAGILNGQ